MGRVHTKSGIDSAIAKALTSVRVAQRAGVGLWLEAVNEMRRRVVLAIAQGGPLTPYTADALKNQVRAITEQFTQKFYDQLSENQRRLFVKGLRVVDEAVASADLRLAIPHLSEATLKQAQSFGAELVTNLTDYARGQIAQQIDLAVLGQKPLEETLAGIGTNLKDSSIFSSIAQRAETIYKTEVNRIANLATDERLKQAAGQIPDIQKRWVHSHVGIPRAGHLLLDNVTIPADEQFTLMGRDGKTYLIDMPHDPSLPAGETVNCRCQIVPVVARHARDPDIRVEMP